jgi:DNA-binding CsgD family transcriptional regulator
MTSRNREQPPTPDTRIASFRFGDGESYLVISYSAAVDPMCGGLTNAERDVVTEVLASRSSREIACARGVSVNTIANQIASAFRKLGVRSRSELALLFARSRSK